MIKTKKEGVGKKITKKKKPCFNAPNCGKMKRIGDRWRKPRGIDNKKRIRRREFGACPRVGYKNTEEGRGVHPLGLKEVLVNNITELEGLDGQIGAIGVRIAGAVSKRKKEKIRARAKEMKLRVFN